MSSTRNRTQRESSSSDGGSEQDNRIFAFSGHTIVIISVAAVLLAVTMGAIEIFIEPYPGTGYVFGSLTARWWRIVRADREHAKSHGF